MTHHVLALDLGTTLGFAYGSGATNAVYGGHDLSVADHESSGMRILRFRNFLHSLPRPHAVYYEMVRRHAGTTAAHVYGALQGELLAWAELHGIPVSGVLPTEIKKSFTGRGNASKDEMIAEAERRGYEWTFGDDNRADALALFCMWVDGEIPRTVTEQKERRQ